MNYQATYDQLIQSGVDPQKATILAQQMGSQQTSMGNQASQDLANMNPELARKIGETYPFSDEQKVYENMQALGSKMGKGTTTPGKYGVFVGDPLGAFAGGAMQTYGGMSALQNALRAKETFGDYAASKAKPDTSIGDTAGYDMQAGVDTGLGAMAARNNQRFSQPQQSTQTYAAKPPVNPMQNATPYGVNGVPMVKPAGMSDEEWATIQSLRG
jgi:hypothetical protein